jgi:hypothetical protein
MLADRQVIPRHQDQVTTNKTARTDHPERVRLAVFRTPIGSAR